MNAKTHGADYFDVAVVIPTYNRFDLVVRALDSVFAQTRLPREVILVDDASTDGSIEAVERRYHGCDALRIVRQAQNGGACRARNRGVAETSAIWIAFLDSDDVWRKDKLALQSAALARAPEAIAAFSGFLCQQAGRMVAVRTPPPVIRCDDLFHENVIGTTSTAVIRRDAFLAAGGFDPAMPSCQDWDLYLRVLAQGFGVAVPEPLVVYDEGEHERISKAMPKVIAGHAEIFRRAMQAAPADEHSSLRASHDMLMAEIQIYRAKRPLLGIALATRAIRRRPDAKFRSRWFALLRHAVLKTARRARRTLDAQSIDR